MRIVKSLEEEVVVKLTSAGEAVYTMNCFPNRDRLYNKHVYSFTLRQLIEIFGGKNSDKLFEDEKIVFPGRQLEMRWESPDNA